jgi:hypothetical protein
MNITNKRDLLMKALLASLALIAAGAAGAETITLGPQSCGILKQCISVPTDTGAAVSIYGAVGYPFFYVTVDGIYYKAAQPSGTVLDTVLVQDPAGNVAYISGSFTTYRTCTRSGRGQTCSTHWQFVGGTVVR